MVDIRHLRRELLESKTSTVASKTRAMYFLRNSDKADQAVDILAEFLRKPGSCLLRHEAAFVLGQMQNQRADTVLAEVLSNPKDDTMVRHECAEALGAIGSPSSLAILQRMADSDTAQEVRETCALAVNFLRWRIGGQVGPAPPVCSCMQDTHDQTQPSPTQPSPSPPTPPTTTTTTTTTSSVYHTVDPAPARSSSDVSVRVLASEVADPTLDLFVRYQSLFALRNTGSDEAAEELGKVLVEDTSSALLRHEVAYVLGQMARGVAIPFLEQSLGNLEEHSMVRHESAEALSAMEDHTSRCRHFLEKYLHDAVPCVAESCAVALDAQDYWIQQDTVANPDALLANPDALLANPDGLPKADWKAMKEGRTPGVSAASEESKSSGQPAIEVTPDTQPTDELSVSVTPLSTPPHTQGVAMMTATSMRKRDACVVMMVLRRRLARGGGGDGGGDGDGYGDGVIHKCAEHVLLMLLGKLKRKGFYYEEDFDGLGMMHYMATDHGRGKWRNPALTGKVRVTRSSEGEGVAEALLDLKPTACCTDDEEDRQWFAVDFGQYRILPTAYTLRHGWSGRDCALTHWVIQASNDGRQWQTLSDHADKSLHRDGWATHTWHLDDEDCDSASDDEEDCAGLPPWWCVEGRSDRPLTFRHLRILQTDVNSAGDHDLNLSGLEVYGVLYWR